MAMTLYDGQMTVANHFDQTLSYVVVTSCCCKIQALSVTPIGTPVTQIWNSASEGNFGTIDFQFVTESDGYRNYWVISYAVNNTQFLSQRLSPVFDTSDQNQAGQVTINSDGTVTVKPAHIPDYQQGYTASVLEASRAVRPS